MQHLLLSFPSSSPTLEFSAGRFVHQPSQPLRSGLDTLGWILLGGRRPFQHFPKGRRFATACHHEEHLMPCV
ncbi:MAG: hypothetical protein AUI36_30150 [Cyanobacteria bacterium 13_1_40CM_2_61_4]|nr:MAG: hypothetical protein AUI36_30150 [Cyanobacteria bacterium 13_1_40CM_2_61_4]